MVVALSFSWERVTTAVTLFSPAYAFAGVGPRLTLF